MAGSSHEAPQHTFWLVTVSVIAVRDFQDDPANATFGGTGWMRDDATIVSGSQ